nr:helix-turn-helix transcriptional regulator [uncultured Acetatifactor sp.]
MGIGTNLKLALKEYDLTVAELSRKTGISTNTFYAMIRRDNNKISPEMLKKICDNTDITVYDLLDNYDELAAKYYDPKASKEEQTIGDYILTTMGNDDNLEGIIEIYGKLNNTGKKIAHEKISELEEVPQFTDSDNNIYIDPNLQKLYEVAMQKALRHEELTEEEEQVIIGIPGQLRQKGNDPLSYENSHPFASSEEELNRVIEQRQKQGEELLVNDYRKLNEIGQSEARKRVSELTEIPRYTKPDDPPQS